MGEHAQQPDTEVYAVVSDKPVEVHDPIRRARIAVLLLVAGVVLSAFAAGWLGYKLGADHTDRRVAALERDTAQRKAARDQELTQLREALCVLLDRQPSAPEVDAQRQAYDCGPYIGPPATTPPPSGAASPRAGLGTPGIQGGPPAGGRPTAAPSSSPRPAPTPSRSPTHSGGVCLPLIGCIL